MNLSPAVIYARYSSSGQREESLTGQIRDCKAYVERNGIKVIKEYTDAAKTGTNDQRPAFQQMIKDSARHQFLIVLVWKLDRFERDTYDSARYKHQLSQNGVRKCCWEEGSEYHQRTEYRRNLHTIRQVE